jgi:hypothetical protein
MESVFGEPTLESLSESVSRRAQNQLIRAGERYALQHPPPAVTQYAPSGVSGLTANLDRLHPILIERAFFRQSIPSNALAYSVHQSTIYNLF